MSFSIRIAKGLGFITELDSKSPQPTQNDRFATIMRSSECSRQSYSKSPQDRKYCADNRFLIKNVVIY